MTRACAAVAMLVTCVAAPPAVASPRHRHVAVRMPLGDRARAHHPQRFAVSSPQGTLRAQVTVAGRRVSLLIRRGATFAMSADLGRLTARPPRRARTARAHASRVSRSFATPAGKRRLHRLDATLLTLRLGHGARLEVLAADDGVAFRQRSFAQPAVSYAPPRGARAWLQPYTRNYESAYVETPLAFAAPGRYGYPALLRAPDGTYVLLTEAGLAYRQAGERLSIAAARPGRLRIAGAGGRPLPSTGWRLAIVGSLADIVASDLPVTLGRPARIADTSWIRPGRVAWSWWSDSWSPQRLDTQRAYVDFAARAGFEYVLVDVGWSAAWMPGLVSYAASRGVRVLVWSDWRALADPATRAATLDRWASWGVAGIKVDYLESDSAARMALMDDIAAAAASRHLLVDFHGCTIPRGLQRTWPNVLTIEAVRGAEHERFGAPDDPALNVTLAFTRNVLGSMDYTPVVFSAAGRRDTAAAELAQAVVYESGLQHFADTPASYMSHPVAMQLLRELPAAWDDTELLDGAPGQSVTLARRDGDRWFVGSISATAARTQAVPLRFLAAGRTYLARIYGDGTGSDVTMSERNVTAADTLELPVAADGGFAIELTPAA